MSHNPSNSDRLSYISYIPGSNVHTHHLASITGRLRFRRSEVGPEIHLLRATRWYGAAGPAPQAPEEPLGFSVKLVSPNQVKENI